MDIERVLVTGATGFLGPWIVAELRQRGLQAIGVARREAEHCTDLAAPGAVTELLDSVAPQAVIHAAAMARMGACEAEPSAALRMNGEVPGRLAARMGPAMVQVSTDLVFDGTAAPYQATDDVAPVSAYGRSKAAGEAAALDHGARIARVPLMFSPGGGATKMIRAAVEAGRTVGLFDNEYRTPLHAADAARGLVELLFSEAAPPVTHLSGPERLSRYEMGVRYCRLHGLPTDGLQRAQCKDPLRPPDVSLAGAWECGRSLDAALLDA